MRYIIILMTGLLLGQSVRLNAQGLVEAKIKIRDTLQNLDYWKVIEHSDTSISISKKRNAHEIAIGKKVSVMKELVLNKAAYRITYVIIDSSKQKFLPEDNIIKVNHERFYKLVSLRKITNTGATIEIITNDTSRIVIPYATGYGERFSLPEEAARQVFVEEYEVPANNYNHFRKRYQNEYVSRKFHPLTLTALVTPMAAYRFNHINEAQFTHAENQQQRTDDERAIFGLALELHAGISFKNKTLYTSLMLLRGGFQSDNSNPIDWKTGLAAAAGTGSRQHLFYQNGVGLGYFACGNKRRLINTCLDVELYYLWLASYKTKGSNGETIYKGATELRSIGVRPHQFGFKFGPGLSIRPNYAFDFSLIPTLYCNLSSVGKSSILRSNLVSYGISAGFTYRWMRNHYRDPVSFRRKRLK